jgi:hypothetical protein
LLSAEQNVDDLLGTTLRSLVQGGIAVHVSGINVGSCLEQKARNFRAIVFGCKM